MIERRLRTTIASNGKAAHFFETICECSEIWRPQTPAFGPGFFISYHLGSEAVFRLSLCDNSSFVERQATMKRNERLP